MLFLKQKYLPLWFCSTVSMNAVSKLRHGVLVRNVLLESFSWSVIIYFLLQEVTDSNKKFKNRQKTKAIYKSDSKPLVTDNNVQRWKSIPDVPTFLPKTWKPLYPKYALKRPVQGTISLMFHALSCEIGCFCILFRGKSLRKIQHIILAPPMPCCR